MVECKVILEGKRKCQFCNSDKTYVKPSGYEQWFKDENGFICRKCHDKRRSRNYTPHPRIYTKKEIPVKYCECNCGGIVKTKGARFLYNHHKRREITKDKDYEYVYAPDHPYKNHRNKVYKHRLVMEEHIGRYLTEDELVHHIDENPKNNDISNLKIVTKGEHQTIHKTKDMSERKCCFCGTSKSYIGKDGYAKWYKMGETQFFCRKCRWIFKRK